MINSSELKLTAASTDIKRIGAGALVLAGVAAYYGSQYFGERAADEPVKLGPAAEGRSVERRPGMGRDPAPPAGDASDAWAVWYVDNMAYKPVMVGTMRVKSAER